jgi:hypothetical protein
MPLSVYTFLILIIYGLGEGQTRTLNLPVVNIDTALNDTLQELFCKSMVSNDNKIIFSVHFR